MESRDEEIRRLEQRLSHLRQESKASVGAPARFPWRVLSSVAVAGLIVTAAAFNHRPSPPTTEPFSDPIVERVQSELRLKIRVSEPSTAERRALDRALAEHFPLETRLDAKAVFYFDGGLMSCGAAAPPGRAWRRYLYRNAFVLAEGDASNEDFAMFWQICQAAGVRP